MSPRQATFLLGKYWKMRKYNTGEKTVSPRGGHGGPGSHRLWLKGPRSDALRGQGNRLSMQSPSRGGMGGQALPSSCSCWDLEAHGMTTLPRVGVTVDLLGIYPFLLSLVRPRCSPHTAVMAGPGGDSPLPGHGLGGLKIPLRGGGEAWICSLQTFGSESPRQGASALGSVECWCPRAVCLKRKRLAGPVSTKNSSERSHVTCLSSTLIGKT